MTKPSKSILDPTFRYVSSHRVDEDGILAKHRQEMRLQRIREKQAAWTAPVREFKRKP